MNIAISCRPRSLRFWRCYSSILLAGLLALTAMAPAATARDVQKLTSPAGISIWLVEDHGVQLRTFPDEVTAALRARAPEVLGQFAEKGGLEKRIHDSYVAMLELMRPWSRESMARFLTARAAA